MSSPAKSLRDLAATQFPNYKLFHAHRPDADPCATFYDYNGTLENRQMSDGSTLSHPGIQVIAAGKTYDEAYAIAQAIYAWVDTLRRKDGLMTVHKTSTILSLGIEDKTRRHLLSFNLRITENP